MVTAIKSQPVTVTVQLEFPLLKTLLISADVVQRTCLCGRKDRQNERHGQNQQKGSAHVHGGSKRVNSLRILTLFLDRSRVLFLRARSALFISNLELSFVCRNQLAHGPDSQQRPKSHARQCPAPSIAGGNGGHQPDNPGSEQEPQRHLARQRRTNVVLV